MNSPLSAKERTLALLKHPDVNTWFKDRSPGTAVVQLEHLRIFLEHTGLEVGDLIDMAKRNERGLKNTVIDFIHERQGAGLKAKYVGNIWWSVRSFLASVDAAPGWNPTVRQTDADEDGVPRAVPTHEQVRQIANSVKSARDRMVVLVLASSGIRIGSFGTQHGRIDGLRLKHLVDLTLRPSPRFEKEPPLLRVPAHLTKANVAYYTGLTEEAAGAVLSYLKERAHRGERLTPDSPLVAPDGRGPAKLRRSSDGFEMVTRKSLGARVQAAMDAVAPKGTRWVPHSLRAFMSTALEEAEARGVISRTRRFYFTAHALGGVDSRYNLSRQLSAEKTEELRADWKRVLPFLSLDRPAQKSVDVRAEILRGLAEAVGIGKNESAKYASATSEEILGLLREKLLGGGQSRKSAGQGDTTAPAVARQMPVPIGEAERLLEQGWTFVTHFDGGRVLMERPGRSR